MNIYYCLVPTTKILKKEMEKREMKAYVRIEVADDFSYTEENPLVVLDWSIYKKDNFIHVTKGDKGYVVSFVGSLFVTEEHCFYRHREFQLLLDKFSINKVKNMTARKIAVSSGLKDVNKGYTIYSDGTCQVVATKHFNPDEPHETLLATLEFSNDTTWALAEVHNTKYQYRILYVWENPHRIMNDINKTGLGNPVLSTEL